LGKTKPCGEVTGGENDILGSNTWREPCDAPDTGVESETITSDVWNGEQGITENANLGQRTE